MNGQQRSKAEKQENVCLDGLGHTSLCLEWQGRLNDECVVLATSRKLEISGLPDAQEEK